MSLLRTIQNSAHQPVGLPISLGILTIYIQRLYLHHLPGEELIVSAFLPLGPCGLGGYSLLKLGKVAMTLLPAALPERSAEMTMLATGLYGGGCVASLCLWALGVSWHLIMPYRWGQR